MSSVYCSTRNDTTLAIRLPNILQLVDLLLHCWPALLCDISSRPTFYHDLLYAGDDGFQVPAHVRKENLAPEIVVTKLTLRTLGMSLLQVLKQGDKCGVSSSIE